MEYKDYYATLDVSRKADEKKIRDAFRKLARRYHPDVNPGDQKAEAKFKEINEAYEVLSNPEKRRKYDRLGANWEQIERDEELRRQYSAGAGAASAEGFSDFFSTFFGGDPGRRGFSDFAPFFGGAADAHGADSEVEVALPLRDAASGTTRRLDLQLKDACPQCHGSGMVAGRLRRAGGAQVAYDAHPCDGCHGTGAVHTRRTVDVRFPPGVTEGTRLRVAGQGSRGSGGPAGDLYVRVRFAPHPVFTANGRDLHAELPVWDFEAALGAEVDAPTLESRVRVRIPPGSHSGQSLRLRGKGLPAAGRRAAGDLLYTLRIVVPHPLDAEERSLLLELQERVTQRHPNPRERLFRDV